MMKPSTAPPQTQQWLAVLAPIIAIVVSVMLVYPAWAHHGELTARTNQHYSELQTIRSNPPPPIGNRIPAAEPMPAEPSQFLGEIRNLAAGADCAMTGFDMTQVPGAPLSDQAVKAVRAKVDIKGTYKQVRNFLWQCVHYPRLLVITETTLSLEHAANVGGPSSEVLTASIGIERYLASTPAAPPSGPAR